MNEQKNKRSTGGLPPLIAMMLLLASTTGNVLAAGDKAMAPARGGDADKNWLQAETEILQLMTPQAATSSAHRQKARGARNRKQATAVKSAEKRL